MRHFGKIALFIQQHQDDGLMTKLSLFPRASKHDVETKKIKGQFGKKYDFRKII